jgi:ketosteroid isomerase-like protein
MGARENADAIRSGYGSFNKGDIAALEGLFDAGAVWHTPGRSSLSGDFKGRDETFAHFGRLGQETGGQFSAELKDVVATDDIVVALHHDHGERNGKTLDLDVSVAFRFEGSTVVEATEYHENLFAWDDFWS